MPRLLVASCELGQVAEQANTTVGLHIPTHQPAKDRLESQKPRQLTLPFTSVDFPINSTMTKPMALVTAAETAAPMHPPKGGTDELKELYRPPGNSYQPEATTKEALLLMATTH